jgi:transcription antitermination factor NusG
MLGARSATVRSKEVEGAIELPKLIPDPWTDSHWYAVQTIARHEKAVSTQLTHRGVDTFLPLHVVTHKWGERKATVELPLFSGYVFVNIRYCERLTVLKAVGVLRIVSFNGLPSPVADEEILALRSVIGMESVEPYKFLATGRKVRISSGALEGLEGVVVKRKGNIRFIVSVQAIQQSIAVEVSASDVQCIR